MIGCHGAGRGRFSACAQAGFTLLETLLVLAIFSIAIALVSVKITSDQSGTRAKVTAKKVASAMNYARNQSLRERDNWRVEGLPGRIVIYPERGGRAVKEVRLDDGVAIRPLGASTIVFYPSTGSSGGGFEVTDGGERVYYTVKAEPSTGHVMVKAR